jgi:8-oxo-dGTP diphosphatase
MTLKDFHLGIYGIIMRANEILVTRKSRGPYTNQFDLPGGRPIYGEPIIEALKREIKEETGVEIKNFSLFGNFSYFINYKDLKNTKKKLYHIALIYKINSANLNGFNSDIVEEDVNGSLWINRANIQINECSPLLKTVIENYEK